MRSALVVAGVLAVLSVSGCGAEAQCAAPEIMLSSSEVAQGDELTVTVNGLSASCNDTGQGPASVATDVPITLVFASQAETIELGTAGADANGMLTETVEIPSDAPTGLASLYVGGDFSVPVTIAAAP